MARQGSAKYQEIVRVLGLDKPRPVAVGAPNDRFGAIMEAMKNFTPPPQSSGSGENGKRVSAADIAKRYKGKRIEDLPPALQRAIWKTNQSDEISAALGKVRPKKRSWLEKGVHAIGKPSSAMQKGFMDALEYSVFDAKDSDGDRDLGDLIKSTGKFFGGLKEGWNADYGKQTYLYDNIQEFYDRRKAVKEGLDDDQYTSGSAKVSPWLKYGVGLVGEIAMDPTTYLTGGTSIVARGATRGGGVGAAKTLNETAETLKKVQQIDKGKPLTLKNGAATPEMEDLLKAVGADLAPKLGRRGKSTLTPEARQIYDWAQTAQKSDKSLKMERGIAGKRVNQRGNSGKKYSEILDEIGTTTVRGWAETRRAQIAKELSLDKIISAGAKADAPKVSTPKAPAAQISPDVERAAFIYKGKSALNFIQRADRTMPVGTSYIQRTTKKGFAESAATRDLLKQAGLITQREGTDAFVWVHKTPEESRDALRAWAIKNQPRSKNAPVGTTDTNVKTAATSPEAIAEKAARKQYNMAVSQVDQALKTEQAAKGIKDSEIQREVAGLLLRNLSPDLAKVVKVKLGPAELKIVAGKGGEGIAKGYRKAKKAEFAGKSMETSIRAFNDAFRASANITPELNQVRQANWGYVSTVSKALADEANAVFMPGRVPAVEAKSVFRSVMNGNTLGAKSIATGPSTAHGGRSVDMAKYIEDQVNLLDETLKGMNLGKNEVERWFKPLIGERKYLLDKRTNRGTVIQGAQAKTVIDIDHNPNWFRDVMKQAAKDGMHPAEALYITKMSVQRLTARRGMMESVAQTWGVPMKHTVEFSGDAGPHQYANRLRQVVTSGKNGWKAPDGVPGLKDYRFEPEMADAISRMFKVFDSQRQTEEMMHIYDKALRTWKSTVTRYNPAFHIKTLLGEIMLGYIGGVVNPKRYAQASKVLHGRNKEFMGPGEFTTGTLNRTQSRAMISRANMLEGAVNPSPFSPVGRTASMTAASKNSAPVLNFHGRMLKTDEVWHLYNEMGLKSGYLSNELVGGIQKYDKLGLVTQRVNAVTEATEDYPRLAHFIDGLAKSKKKDLTEAAKEAAVAVKKYHLDYTNVTNFEQTVMTRLFPFYKWLRLSTPLMAQAIFTNPGRVATLSKMPAAISGLRGYDVRNGEVRGDVALPNWMKESMAFPIGNIAGNTNYFDPTGILPLGAIEAGSEGGGGAFSKVTPIIGTPAQALLDKSSFGAKPSADWSRFAAGQTPQTNFAHKLATNGSGDEPKWQTVLAFLMNPGIQANTRDRIANAITQEQKAAGAWRNDAMPETPSERKTRLKKEAGMQWPT